MSAELDEVERLFYEVRGRDDDREWARAAYFRLTAAEVSSLRALQVLSDGLVLIGDAREPLNEVLGDPANWSSHTIDSLRSFGIDPREPEQKSAWGWMLTAGWIAVIYGAITAISLCLFFWDGIRLSPGLAFLPHALGATVALTVPTYHAHLRRRGFWPALAIASAVATTCAAVWIAVSWLLRDVAVTMHPLWYLVVLAGTTLLVLLLTRFAPAPRPVPPTTGDWYEAYADRLRMRGVFRPARIAYLVSEARSHAEESGTSPQDEFGDPGAMADSLPAPRGVTEFRGVMLWTPIAVLLVVVLVGNLIQERVNWFMILAVAVLIGLRAVPAWIRWVRARPRPEAKE